MVITIACRDTAGRCVAATRLFLTTAAANDNPVSAISASVCSCLTCTPRRHQLLPPHCYAELHLPNLLSLLKAIDATSPTCSRAAAAAAAAAEYHAQNSALLKAVSSRAARPPKHWQSVRTYHVACHGCVPAAAHINTLQVAKHLSCCS
jgi:hypothetical protein